MLKYLLISISSLFLITSCASKFKKSDGQNLKAIGHRGAAGYAPENTLPAFSVAKQLGVKDVELDVQLSADDEVILFHDVTLDTKTNRKGTVGEFKTKDLLKTEIGEWFDKTHPDIEKKYKGTYLTTLDQVFKDFGRDFYFHVELKSEQDKLPEAVLKKLGTHNQLANTTITSFYLNQLIKTRALNAQIPICYLVKGDSEEQIATEIKKAKENGFTEVAVNAEKIEKSHVKLAQKNGLRIRGWGIKKRSDFDRLRGFNVYGTTLDWPDWVKPNQ